MTYLTFNGGGSGQEQANDTALPFSVSVPLGADGLFDSSIFSLVAEGGEAATTITCRIILDGEVLSEQTSAGQSSVVT